MDDLAWVRQEIASAHMELFPERHSSAEQKEAGIEEPYTKDDPREWSSGDLEWIGMLIDTLNSRLNNPEYFGAIAATASVDLTQSKELG